MYNNPAPLLEYDFSTLPFPLQASPPSNPTAAQLTLVATNSTGNTVELKGIGLVIPVGDDGNALTADVSQIESIPPDGWQQDANVPRDNGIELVFTPQSGSFSLDNAASLLFVFNNIIVNTVQGTVTLTVIEGSSASNPSEPLYVTKFPSGWGSVEFSANPSIINEDGSTTLSWNGPAGATYTLQYYTPQTGIVNVPAAGAPALSNSGSYPGQNDPPLTLQQTTAFTLNVSENSEGQQYSAQDQVTVTVVQSAPGITSFEAQPASVCLYTAGGDAIAPPPPPVAKLSWTTLHAISCTLDDDPTLLAPNGSLPISPSSTTVYSLTAEGANGLTANAQTTYTVIQAGGFDLQVSIESNTIGFHIQYNLVNPANSRLSLVLYWTGGDTNPLIENIPNPTSAPQMLNNNFWWNVPYAAGVLSFVIWCQGPETYSLSGNLYEIT